MGWYIELVCSRDLTRTTNGSCFIQSLGLFQSLGLVRIMNKLRTMKISGVQLAKVLSDAHCCICKHISRHETDTFIPSHDFTPHERNI